MKLVHDELFTLLIIISSIIMASLAHLTCCSATADRGITCRHENEKQSLLRFKHSHQNSSIPSQLSSWKAEVDCCSWEGVVCNNITGHVVELNIQNSGLTGELDDHFLLNLTHLTHFDMRFNEVQGALPRAANITKLKYFDISLNLFSSAIPDWLYECKYLEYLDARGNSLQGSISNSIGNLTSLKFLDLSRNMLSGEIPTGIAKLGMQYLDFSYNKFGGDILYGFGNMSNCFLQSLEYLDLSNNQLYGNLPYQLGGFKRLRHLNLAENKFTGNLPESMGQLFNLESFDIGNNMLEGIVTETHFANLTNLYQFTASGNHLTLKISDNWIPNFKIQVLTLGSWNLGAGGQIPEWLDTQKNTLMYLDFSNTGIVDPIPSWFWGIESTLNLSNNKLRENFDDHVILTSSVIDLSSNLYNGPLPRINETIILNLSNNSFSGGVENFLCHQTTTNSTFQSVNLAQNLLSGELPDCFMKHPFLAVLNLGNNNISGCLPQSMGKLESLECLDLFNNRLSGQIPSSMQNCTNLWKVDLSSNQLIGRLPAWMGTKLPGLNFLILRSNKLAGTISSGICRLSNLRILDLSDNKFSGKIPNCMDNFTAMASSKWIVPAYDFIRSISDLHESATVATKGTRLYYDTILSLVTNIDLSSNNLSGDIPHQLTSLAELRSVNLSRNHLNGKIPDGMEGMKVLESLDLSNNLLSGNIPHSIAFLSPLNYLDLSYNNLSGEIPQSTQLSTFNASSFVGNNLCGPPLTFSCNGGEIPARSVPGGHDKDGDGKSELEWLYVFVSLGYAVGLAIVCNVLVFKKSWRDAFFESVDNMWNKHFANARKKRSWCG